MTRPRLRTSLVRCLCGTALLAVSTPAPADEEEGFVPLFDGKTLDGWKKVGGGATYRIEADEIVGEVGPGSNTFLRTEKTYGDFILKLDVKLDVPGNSGIQFRSHQRARKDGRVFGYQCEIDPSDRAWTGGHLRRGPPRLALPAGRPPRGPEGVQEGRLERLRHRGPRPAPPHLAQRRPLRRPDGHDGPRGLHRPPGPRRQGGPDPLEEHPDQGARPGRRDQVKRPMPSRPLMPMTRQGTTLTESDIHRGAETTICRKGPRRGRRNQRTRVGRDAGAPPPPSPARTNSSMGWRNRRAVQKRSPSASGAAS